MMFHLKHVFLCWICFPNRACTDGVLTVLSWFLRSHQLCGPEVPRRCRGGAAELSRAVRQLILIRKNKYLVALALVSPRRNRGSRAQTSIFTMENQLFLVQMAPWSSWPPDESAESLEARSPQPGVLSQESSARIPQQKISVRNPQPRILSQESAGRIPQPAVSSQCVWGPRWSYMSNFY